MAWIQGKEAREWIDDYVEKKGPKLIEVTEGLRRLVKKTVSASAESVNPWRIPTFESNGPMCFFMMGKSHVTFGFLRGTSLPDPEKLLEGTEKNLRHVKLRTVEELKRSALKKLIVAAAKMNKKEPMEGMRVKEKKAR
jgi:hypothetical protein